MPDEGNLESLKQNFSDFGVGKSSVATILEFKLSSLWGKIMSEINNSSKHEQCQALPVWYCYFITFIIMFLSQQGCQKKKWDPNQQFENEVDRIIQQRDVSILLDENIAKQNLRQLNLKLKDSLYPGLGISNFNNLVGPYGQIVAEKNEGGKMWITIKYLWKDVVAQHFGIDSSEYKYCSKTKFYLEVVANDTRIVSISWL